MSLMEWLNFWSGQEYTSFTVSEDDFPSLETVGAYHYCTSNNTLYTYTGNEWTAIVALDEKPEPMESQVWWDALTGYVRYYDKEDQFIYSVKYEKVKKLTPEEAIEFKTNPPRWMKVNSEIQPLKQNLHTRRIML